MDESESISVVLADDHAIVREGFAALCVSKGMRVIGQAGDGREALDMVRALRPDFAILDLHMPEMSGSEVARRLRAGGYTAKLMILSISREETAVREALRSGADAYLLKDGPARHLVEAIQYVREGGVYISPLLRGAAILTGNGSETGDPMSSLSPREIEVFTQLVNGIRAKDIAERLEISPKTVDTYRASLMRKLNIHDLAGLVKFAIQRNLTSAGAC